MVPVFSHFADYKGVGNRSSSTTLMFVSLVALSYCGIGDLAVDKAGSEVALFHAIPNVCVLYTYCFKTNSGSITSLIILLLPAICYLVISKR